MLILGTALSLSCVKSHAMSSQAVAKPEVYGALPPAEIGASVRKFGEPLDDCYAKLKKKPKMGGVVTVNYTVEGETGKVIKAKAQKKGTTIKNKKFR